MYIAPISVNNYSNKFNNNYKQNRVSQPNFKGALSDREMDRVIKLLASKNTEVFDVFSPTKLNEVMNSLVNKYKSLGVNSLGIQIVDPQDLPALLGKNISKYNNKNKFGICVAVGDKNAPIEQMNKIYEAKTFLLTEKELNTL